MPNSPGSIKSIAAYLERGGGSRGSYLVLDDSGEIIEGLGHEWRFRPELPELNKYTLEYRFCGESHLTKWVPVRDIPEDNFGLNRSGGCISKRKFTAETRNKYEVISHE